VIVSTGIALFELLIGPVSKKKAFNESPFPYHREIELTITTLTNLGLGLGRVALAEGGEPKWVVMVAFALPGERIRARVFRNHANYSEADLVEVLTPSPHRVEPRCPLFGRCGGCQYQNLAYAEQLEWKRSQVAELLEHMAGLTAEVSPVIGSPRQFGYRSKITPHFNAPREGQELAIGFLRQGTRFDIVDVPRCEIATEPINALLAHARTEIKRRAGEGAFERGATLLFRDAGGKVTTHYEDRVTEEVPLGDAGTLRLGFLARDFFQNNPYILPAFAGYVRDQARQGGARFLVDAYCGSGLFALASASAFERVVGVEVSESSVAFATENAAANGIANATFRAGDASAIFSGLDFGGEDAAVVIDPPRRGCDQAFLRQLFGFRPRAVVYVSCDPATQMRDLKGFLSAGYRATAVQPFDLFPQTRHLECVITLARA
jgi:tRNA/tmRNA/rRNA uracil-C5-methylase (TrmA/RlmC/RlmD family)